MTLKELFIKRNDRMNDFRLNYYATVLVVSGYLAVAGSYIILPVVLLSYLNLRNYSTISAEEELSRLSVEIAGIDKDGNEVDEDIDISPDKIEEIKSYLTEKGVLSSRKLTDLMNLELIIVLLVILYRVGTSI